MNNQKFEYNIIESLVSVLVESPDFPAGQDCGRKEAAYQLKQFADIMPGGFFIYRADEEETLIYANEALLRI